MQETSMTNPLLENWDEPFGLPPFERVRPEHFAPAFEQAMAAHNAEIERIASASAGPSFENTIATLDRSGRLLRRTEQLFFNLAASETSPQLQAVERHFAPKLAANENAILLNQKLFARIEELYAQRSTLSLSTEQTRLLERLHLDSVLAGPRVSGGGKKRIEGVLVG